MEVAKIFVSENRATVQNLKMITSGTIGATVSFEFDETWEGFTKTYVFRAGNKTRDDLDATGVIPAELLKKHGVQLEVGVYGTKGDLVLPTAWASLGNIVYGADPSGDPSTNPHLPVWKQLQQDIEELQQGGGGGASSKEWITIADITTTEEINKIWQDAPGFKRIMMYVYLPSDLSVKSFYGFYTSDMWSSLFGFGFTGEGRKLLLDFEVIDDLGVTLQLNINGNNSSVTNVNNGKLLREGTETELNGVGTALQSNGLFPVGTVIKIRGLKA